MKQIKISFVLLVVCTMLCISLSHAATTTSTPQLKPRYGGILKMLGYEPYSLGYPATMTANTDGQQASVCLETLFRFDEKGELTPLLATSWKADPKAKTITVTLRKGVKFHDGSDFNAKVCKWNFDRFREGKRPELTRVESVDVVDDYTVRLNLLEFDNVIPSHFAHDAGRMISQAAFEKNGQAWCEKNPVGTGAFQFVSWQKDIGIKFKRFDGYWGGKPYLDGIEMARIPDPVADLMTFKTGGKHIILLEPKDAKDLEAEGKWNIVVPPEGQVAALAGNSRDPKSPFADIRVRQALWYAIDFKVVADAFGRGYFTALNQWARPGQWSYNPAVKGYPFNPKKAKQLLAAAGYPNGFKTTMYYFANMPYYTDEMTAVQRYLKDVGIDATLEPLQRPRFAEMASLGKGWEGIVRMQGFWRPDTLSQVAGWMAGNEFSEVTRIPEINALYIRASTAPDFATKKKLTQQLMALWTDKYCLSAIVSISPLPIGKSKKLHDDLYGVVPNRYLSPKAWLSE
jgi:ABC-type transport system substrate-binding protein